MKLPLLRNYRAKIILGKIIEESKLLDKNDSESLANFLTNLRNAHSHSVSKKNTGIKLGAYEVSLCVFFLRDLLIYDLLQLVFQDTIRLTTNNEERNLIYLVEKLKKIII